MLKLLRRLRYLLRHRTLEAELLEELEFHRAERQREREGMPPSDAEYDSRKALGVVLVALSLGIGANLAILGVAIVLLCAIWITHLMSHLLGSCGFRSTRWRC